MKLKKHTIKTPPTSNTHLVRWVEKMADLCQPSSIQWVDGSEKQYQQLCEDSSSRALSRGSIKSFGRVVSWLGRRQMT